MSEATPPYKASSQLILSGGLKTKAQAKCYHALLVLAHIKKWKYDAKGSMRVSLGDLHRMTNRACESWPEYLSVLNSIKKDVELDWAHLSRNSEVKRIGKTSILSEVFAELDLSGEFHELVFRIPAHLLEEIIAPAWFGQIDTEILFCQRSNYAFHAYLMACLTVIEKDSNKSVFYSHGYQIAQWRDLLGVEKDIYPTEGGFTWNVFKRIEKQIDKTTASTSTPITIKFIKTKTGLYQMMVSTGKSAELKGKSASKLQIANTPDTNNHRVQAEQEEASLLAKIKAEPNQEAITRILGQGPFTYLLVSMNGVALKAAGIDADALLS